MSKLGNELLSKPDFFQQLYEGQPMSLTYDVRREEFELNESSLDKMYIYKDYLVNRDTQFVLNTDNITRGSWANHFKSVYNILLDYIETDYVQNVPIRLEFGNTGKGLNIYITDYLLQLTLWRLIVATNRRIMPYNVFDFRKFSGGRIKKYIDEQFIEPNRRFLSNKLMNNLVTDTVALFYKVNIFRNYLADTITMNDDAKMCIMDKEYYNLLHQDFSKVPLEQVKDLGMDKIRRVRDVVIERSHNILGYDHYGVNCFIAEEGISLKQLREGIINIGVKPASDGGVYDYVINTSYINGGLDNLTSLVIDSSIGRDAQILSKTNVSDCGYLSRKLVLNCSDLLLNTIATHVCDTQNLLKVEITNEVILNRFKNRYYRHTPDGPEYRLSMKDRYLVGSTLYFRSPITCSSMVHGHGICYRCYGDLAYTNNKINVGIFAAEAIGKVITQLMLSAKHILEVFIRKLNWNENFDRWFEVNSNGLSLKEEAIASFKSSELNHWYVAVDQENIQEESYEDEDNSSDDYKDGESEDFTRMSVTQIHICSDNGDDIVIEEEDNEEIFLSEEYASKISKQMKKNKTLQNFDSYYGITFKEAISEDSDLFYIVPQDDGLGKTMRQLSTILDNKKALPEDETIEDMVAKLLELSVSSGLSLDSVHFETIVSAQVRSAEHPFEYPDWSKPGVKYKVLSLKDSLYCNGSISKSMEFERIGKQLSNPSTFDKHKGSYLDLFFVEKPLEYCRERRLNALRHYRDEKRLEYIQAHSYRDDQGNLVPFKFIKEDNKE